MVNDKINTLILKVILFLNLYLFVNPKVLSLCPQIILTIDNAHK